MREYFEGFYLKHQSDGRTLALIPGVSNDGAFVQIITDNGSYNISYPRNEYQSKNRHDQIRVGGNIFSREGIKLDIEGLSIRLTGELRYSGLTPIKSDIMGPFRFLPMECRHGVVSMRHRVSGEVVLNGEIINFNNGLGYIEYDRGRSFPQEYVWIHCNDFDRKCSIMASAAHIPFAGMRFWGCICVVWLDDHEYRLATYGGAKICRRENGVLVLTQGKYRFEAHVEVRLGHSLLAPQSGSMRRIIFESAACPTYFKFSKNDNVLFEGNSAHASCEFVAQPSL